MPTPLRARAAPPAPQSRITKEAAWLDTFAKSGAKQGELCGAFGGNARACTVLAYNAQRAKVRLQDRARARVCAV